MKKTALILSFCLVLLAGCGRVDSVDNSGNVKPFEIENTTKSGSENDVTGDHDPAVQTGAAMTTVSGDTVTTTVRTGAVQLVKRTGVTPPAQVTTPTPPIRPNTPSGGNNGGGGNTPAPPQTNPPATSIHRPAATTTVTTTPAPIGPTVITKDGITCSLKDNGVEVRIKAQDGSEKTQLIGLDQNIVEGIKNAYIEGKTAPSQRIVIADFDFDGVDEIFIPTEIGEYNTLGVYKKYDEASGQYTDWDGMNAVSGYAEANGDTQTIQFTTRKNEHEYETLTYSWQDIVDDNGQVIGKQLVPVNSVNHYRLDDSPEELWNVYVDYCDFADGKKQITKREKLIFNEVYEVVGAEEIEITWETID
ncbi:MAG: hypothetical protein J6K77_07165 [Ruminococcus sp.]|nr:hypothetical protein [Ruminococcus sp.]